MYTFDRFLPPGHPVTMPISRYPRPGQPIAPKPLRELLMAEHATRFAHLDSTVWDRMGEDACRKLAGQLLTELVGRGPRFCALLAHHRLESRYGAIAVEDLELQPRTLNCLRRAGISEFPSGRHGLTVGQILQLRGFGVRSLIDLMSSVEAYTAHQLKGRCSGNNDKDLATAKDALLVEERQLIAGMGSLPGALEISRYDPRLGQQLRHVAPSASTLGELLESFHRGELLSTAEKNLARLCVTVRTMVKRSVVDEAIEILAAGQPESARRIVEACLQFRGSHGRPTYQAVGKRFGRSRERIRQILCRQLWRPGQPRPFAPALDAALAAVQASGPSSPDDVQRRLVRDKLLAPRMQLDALHEVAGMLGREPGFTFYGQGQGRLVIAASDLQAVQQLLNEARGMIYRSGAATVARLMDNQQAGPICREAAVRAIRSLDGFYWLNESEGSFSLHAGQANVLWHRIRKVLSVAPRVAIDDLWAALLHDNRPICGGLTADQVLDFCRKQPECRVINNTVVLRHPQDPLDAFRGHEREIVRLILKHGPLCRRGELMELAAQAGMGKPSFDKSLNCPAIARYAPGVYGLTGANISPGEIAAFVERATAR